MTPQEQAIREREQIKLMLAHRAALKENARRDRTAREPLISRMRNEQMRRRGRR